MILVLITPSFFTRAAVDQNTITYLSGLTQNGWITQGLKAAGQNNLNLDYLNNFDGSSVTDFSLAILAAVAGGQNPSSVNGHDFVASLSALAQDNQLGDAGLINDDMWGITALRSAGVAQDNQLIQNSKNYILAHQAENGGWSFSATGESDTNDTAAAIWALAEAGQALDSEPITRAVAYLHSAQNQDGGMPFSPGGTSDSGSGAWTIIALNKLSTDPATWTQGENNLLTNLNSLKLNDGSFKWRAQDDQANSLMTAYAAVALAGSSYPVARYQAGDNDNNGGGGNNEGNEGGNGGGVISNGLHHLRVEGANQTICETDVAGATALAVLENGAAVCNYQYHIQQTAWGPYLDEIAGEQASGENGWNYRVNWISPEVGANDYHLEEADYVLWYFSNWVASPLKITLDNFHIDVNGSVSARVEYLNGNEWLRVNGATVKVNGNNYTTNEDGDAVIQFNQANSYLLYAEKDNFVRSQREVLTVGEADQARPSVGLRAVIQQDNNGGGGGFNPGDVISLAVETANLDFGNLHPGDQADRVIRIANRGNVSVYVEGVVSGDSLFSNNLYLNSTTWENFQTNLTFSGFREVNVSLRVPDNYQGSGVKEGNLVFWASGNLNN